jgi:hypothetical protein
MKAHKDLRFTEPRKPGHSAQHRASGLEWGSWEGRHPVWGSHGSVKASSNVIEAVASASRYKRYKIDGK